jgi:hypothetical protein
MMIPTAKPKEAKQNPIPIPIHIAWSATNLNHGNKLITK